MDFVFTAIKALPTSIAAVAQVILVAIIFLAAITFLAGIWVGICILKKKASYITKFTLIPFTLEFKPKEDKKEALPEPHDDAKV